MRRRLLLGSIVLILLLGAVAIAQHVRNARAPKGETPVAVFAAPAQSKDVAVVRRGLGQVQAYNTVTVRSRVDGAIVQVAFKEGQPVHIGDLLMQIDPKPFQAQLAQAEANRAKDQASLENARRDLARYADLIKNGFTTRQTFESQQAQVAGFEATVKADEAQIAFQRNQLTYTHITSPIDGVTGLRQVDIGNLVTAAASTPLVVVTQLQPIALTFTLPERMLGEARQAMLKNPLTVEAWDADDKTLIATGQLETIDNQVDPASGTVRLKAVFANDDQKLWPGAFVNAHLIIETVRGGMTVPSAAVQIGPKGRFVFLIGGEGVVNMRPVEVAEIESGEALISKGLQPGDLVVISGQTRLKDGTHVAVQKQPMFEAPSATGELSGQTPQLIPAPAAQKAP